MAASLRRTPDAFAVVCHPHPLHGGTMHNKVVYTAGACLRHSSERADDALQLPRRGRERAVATTRVAGETEDALAVIAYGRARWPGAALSLAGFSFGGVIALRAASRSRCERVVAVAPRDRPDRDRRAGAPSCPWLIVQGDADEVVDRHAAVLAWAQRCSRRRPCMLLAGAGHFFHGRLIELRERCSGSWP